MIKIFLPALLLLFFSQSLFSMSYEQARHLLHRTGFGASEPEINRMMKKSYKEGVESILNSVRKKTVTPVPGWSNRFPKPLTKEQRQKLTQEQKKNRIKKRREQSKQFQNWWMKEMVETSSPFTEKMVLFWHNHFVSDLRKSKHFYMFKQMELFRKHLLGNFKDMVKDISQDPAMLIYLDVKSNVKGKPNENYARELLELFTLGEGNYTEADIKELAKAFTGYSVDNKTGEFKFNERRHDSGNKTILGVSGNFKGIEIVDKVLFKKKSDVIAYYIAQKAWKNFVSAKVNRKEVKAIAEKFKKSNFHIRVLMKEIFMSPTFRNPKNFGTAIKSPVDLVVGTIRTLRIPVKDYSVLVQYTKKMGQDILNPPNVKGWEGGTSWISSYSLGVRRQFLSRLTRGKEEARMKMNRMRKKGKKQKKMLETSMGVSYYETVKNVDRKKLNRLLLTMSPIIPPDNSAEIRDYIGEVLQDPVYQLN